MARPRIGGTPVSDGDTTAAAAFVGVSGAVLGWVFWVAPRLARRRKKALAARWERSARTKGDLDDLMDLARAAGVDNPCPMAPELVDEPVDPDQRTNTGLVRVGRALVHPQCARARRDGRPVCQYCAPALVGEGR